MNRRYTGVGSTNFVLLLTGMGSSVYRPHLGLWGCPVAFGEPIVYLCRRFTVTTDGRNRDRSEFNVSSGGVFYPRRQADIGTIERIGWRDPGR